MTPDSKETSLRERIADEVRFKKWISNPQKFIDMLVDFTLEQRALEAEVAAERCVSTRYLTEFHRRASELRTMKKSSK